MDKFFRGMFYRGEEVSQEKFSLFVALIYGISIGILTFILYLTGIITETKDFLGYSSTIILASLGFKVGSSVLRDTNNQVFGSPRGENPYRIRKEEQDGITRRDS